ncbi:Methyltransferase type 12 [Desulfurispirillum indicum S5]|uniref:Methyltransferase type 12 n=1 Tax=Desulfurispirillum indicum (strain ATCC BAA-1389 / DSM 22839 / S5) TaxID=653733 RepID=E6W5W4_DESIS|nr:methyltransferase domain-containing protein [Desulfurispirillum indicum]ADU67249.1 Methyltransferase type 12 [Desulfurispirillum indicum S5]
MEQDREKWNQRYRDNPPGQEPLELVESYARQLSPGRALDIACGLGRHSRVLAALGFTVDAVDISDVAIKHLQELELPGIHARCVDLDQHTIAPDSYQLILNINFLHRPLFPSLFQGLQPGGMLIFRTFMDGPENQGTPMTKEHLLQPNELLHQCVPHLRILHYREYISTRQQWGQAWAAELVGRRPEKEG